MLFFVLSLFIVATLGPLASQRLIPVATIASMLFPVIFGAHLAWKFWGGVLLGSWPWPGRAFVALLIWSLASALANAFLIGSLRSMTKSRRST